MNSFHLLFICTWQSNWSKIWHFTSKVVWEFPELCNHHSGKFFTHFIRSWIGVTPPNVVRTLVGMGPVKKHCKNAYLFLTLGKLKDLFFLWKNVVSLAVSLVTLEERLKFPPLELEPFFVPAKVTWGLWLFAKIDFSNLAIFSSREIKALPPSWSESTPVSLRLLTWKEKI